MLRCSVTATLKYVSDSEHESGRHLMAKCLYSSHIKASLKLMPTLELK